jgi:hypothetical protein
MGAEHELTLREKAGDQPSGLIEQIRGALDQLVPDVSGSAGKFLAGKAEAEWAKAAEIKARVIAAIGNLETESRRIRQEGEISTENARLEQVRASYTHSEKMYQLRTERLSQVVEAIVRLRELGVEIRMSAINSLVRDMLDSTKIDDTYST